MNAITMPAALVSGAAPYSPPWFAGLVRGDHVYRAVYTDPEIFRHEMRLLFGRAWILVGHDSQLREPDSYFTAHVGDRSIIVARAPAGEIVGLYNRCAHRGARICVADSGRAKRLVCPYHGWAFDHGGGLTTVPYETGYPEPLDRAAYGLARIARVATYRGFIFASLAADGPDLPAFLGHMSTVIDDLVDRSPTGEVELVGPPLRHHFDANWKTTFENLNDVLHPGFAHAASVVAAKAVEAGLGDDPLVPSLHMMKANGKPMTFFENLPMVTTEHGHSYIGGHMGASYTGETQSEYFHALASFHGEAKAREVLAVDRHLMLLYPSSTWHARYQTVRILRPIAVDRTEMIGYVFRLVGAPAETFRNAIEYCNGANSAASHVISDDLEIYERVQAGLSLGPADWVPMARGLHQLAAEPGVGDRSPATSEQYIRSQFAAWAAWMGT